MQTTATRKTVMLSLDVIVRFDNKAILAAKDSVEACRLAEHTLARLKQLKAPRRYFELVLREALMKRKEMQKRNHFFMFDKTVISIATQFGKHATTKTKEDLIVIAGYLKIYWFFKETVQALRNGPVTPEEFLAMANCYSVSSKTMDEQARQMVRDALNTHGSKVGQEVLDALQKRYDDWNDLPDL